MGMFVIDSSVVCGWLITSQSTAYTQAIRAQLLSGQAGHAVAPPLLPLEYSNVLRTACKRGSLNSQQALALIGALANLPIEIDAAPMAPAEVFTLSIRYSLTSYDACYLALALKLQIPIATQDVALAEAAMVAGVGVVSAGD